MSVAPPVAKVDPTHRTIHGETRADPYGWLRNRGGADVLAYLEAENDYTKRMMNHTEDLQQRLFEEMKGRLKETDLTVPTKHDEYYYYTRTVEGRQYRIHCRKHGSLDAAEEIILDQNELATGHEYFRLGAFEFSPNHKLLAYSTDTAGSETYTLRIKDLTTGEMLPDTIENTYYSLEWGNDNATLFYTVLDDAMRPYRLMRHILGTEASADRIIHEEKDERFFVRVSKTRSKKFLLLRLGSQITSEIRVLDAGNPRGVFTTIEPRRQGVEYSVDHHGDDFFIVTNDDAMNFRLMRAPVESPSRGNWTEVIEHRPAVRLTGVDMFANHMAIYERQDGLRRLRLRNLKDGSEHYVSFDDPVYTFYATGNAEFDTDTIRYSYTSLVTPRSVYDYNMNTRAAELKKRQEVLGGFDPALYTSQRIAATAKDGTKVPISLVYRKGLVLDGRNPCLLYGYGSYGASMDPRFSSRRLSLLDRGFVYAIAHIRGGGDMGRPWYDGGKLLKKKNTFTDFIACAEHLIDEGFTSRDRLAIMGGSAGGLLMGAVTNMRPDLFSAVVAQVPFVDVINTMLDPSIPLTVIEYEEWGNPHEKESYDYMLSYSPYDNVEQKDYPNMLITAGLNDPRVQYWEPAKWTAKLRANRTDDNLLLLKTNMGAGHGGASGRYDAIRERAFAYAFIIDQLGAAN
ncbi:MAG: S9 family peptidase [Planctomycetes bacterium]|nr:S9 family peptidase [Planctomycetota bacterium]